ncbi:hypothetical protein [Actinoplanes sp. NPDC026619]|uniref:hypothetical protein n=1 Tax=Actinoplanes sp. NPDC026619 TaxID=3155798 RepID=UPI00340CF4DF
MTVNVVPAWNDRAQAWWVKADRAQEHLDRLRGQVDDYRESTPYALVGEPTDEPGLTAYRLRYVRPVPTAIHATVGDVLSNLRSALESLAYGLAAMSNGGTLTPEQESATTFPIRESPEKMDEFFAKTEKRFPGLFNAAAMAALRSVQSFYWTEWASQGRVEPIRPYDDDFLWHDLHRLDRLWNVDKHRRLAVLRWSPELIWWNADEASDRQLLAGEAVTDGSVLFYLKDADPNRTPAVQHRFSLVLADDPAYGRGVGPETDMLNLLDSFYETVTTKVVAPILRKVARP